MGTLLAKISQDSERGGSSEGKESACSAGDWGLIPGLGKSPGEGNGNPLQYSCLENSTDRGAWQAMVYAVAKRQMWLNVWAHSYILEWLRALMSKVTEEETTLWLPLNSKLPTYHVYFGKVFSCPWLELPSLIWPSYWLSEIIQVFKKNPPMPKRKNCRA